MELGDVSFDELPEGRDVLIHAEEVFFLAGADDAPESAVGHIDKDEIALVEQTVGILSNLIRRRARRATVGGHDADRPERSHAQPHRRASRAAVVKKR